MFKNIDEKLVSFGKLIGTVSVIATIVAVAYNAVFPIYNGDFIILSEILTKCITTALAGFAGLTVSYFLVCIGEIAGDLKQVRKVYEDSYDLVMKHEKEKEKKKSVETPKKPKPEKNPKKKIEDDYEDDDEEYVPRKAAKKKPSLKERLASTVFEEVDDDSDIDF